MATKFGKTILESFENIYAVGYRVIKKDSNTYIQLLLSDDDQPSDWSSYNVFASANTLKTLELDIDLTQDEGSYPLDEAIKVSATCGYFQIPLTEVFKKDGVTPTLVRQVRAAVLSGGQSELERQLSTQVTNLLARANRVSMSEDAIEFYTQYYPLLAGKDKLEAKLASEQGLNLADFK